MVNIDGCTHEGLGVTWQLLNLLEGGSVALIVEAGGGSSNH